LGRLVAILLSAAVMSAGHANAQTADSSAVTAPLGAQAAQSSAPADSAAPALATPDTAMAAPDTAGAEAAAGETAPSQPMATPGTQPIVVYGHATVSDGKPLPEVNVSLFAGGLEAASAVTDTGGAYSMEPSIDRSKDETVVVWFTPPRGMGLVRNIVVLNESRAARKSRQFNPCLARVPLGDSTLVDVQILDQQSYATKIEESGCMEKAEEELVEYDLKYDLQAGSSFTIASSSSDHFTQQFGGTEMAVNTSSTVGMLATVDSVTADGMDLGIEYTDRKSTTDNPQVRGSVDFTVLLGKKVSLLLSPRGELSKFAGFEALPQIETAPEHTLDEQKYMNEMKSIFPVLADHPVAEGDTWSSERIVREDAPGGGVSTATINTTYKLMGEAVYQDRDCLRIDASSTFSVKGSGQNRGNPFTIDMSGTGTSTIYFSQEMGMMLEMSGKSKAEGSFDSMGMKIPVVDEGETKVTISLQ
jgi:hypothetical protein